MTTAPTLTTDRLILRAHRLDDFSDYLTMWNEPIVYRHIGGQAMARSEAWTRLLRYPGHWSLLGYGYWVITDRKSGAFAGDIGFADYQREIEPRLKYPEAGWALSPSYHGLGLASEALKAILDWGDSNLNAPSTVCMIAPSNQASIKLAEKFGYQCYLETEFAGDPTLLFERARPS